MRYAMVGLGFMGSTHLNALANIPQAELVAVASDDPVALSGDLSGVGGNLDRSGQRWDFSNLRRYTSFDEVVKDQDVEAVDLCLPTHLHEAAALAALRAGKHVLVEKPMALDGAACDRMLEAARESGRVLMTGQVLRFWNAYLPLIEAARSGSLGAVRGALFRRRCAAPSWGKWISDASKSGGGVFDLLIHDIDMCIHLFGLPEAVSATGHEDLNSGIDLLTATLYYPGIASVLITGGWHHPKAYPFSMEYTVSFDGGTIEYHSAAGKTTLYDAAGNSSEPPLESKDGFQAELEYFVECAVAGRQPERCRPEESAAAVKLARLMLEARSAKGETLPCRI